MAVDFFAGCFGGVGGLVVGHPFDTVKVLMQMHPNQCAYNGGTFNVFKTVLKQNGIRNGIYAGMTSPLWGIAGINAILFGTYANLKRTKIFDGMETYTSHFLTGAISGLAQSPVGSISELLKIRFQVGGASTTSGHLELLQQIIRTQGLQGIFKGFGITICREVPAYGIYFSSYEYVLHKQTNCQPYNLLQLSVAGGLAGQLSWLLTYPIDVIKTSIQADVTNRYSGIVDCTRKLYQKVGFRGFYRGLAPSLIRAFPTNAVCFVVVDYTYKLCNFFENKPVMPTVAKNTVDAMRLVPCDVQGSLQC